MDYLKCIQSVIQCKMIYFSFYDTNADDIIYL